MGSPTRKQQRALSFIQERIFETGEAPSFEEIAKGCGLASKSAVARYVGALIERGAITNCHSYTVNICGTRVQPITSPPAPHLVAKRYGLVWPKK